VTIDTRIVQDFSSIAPDEWENLDRAGNPFLAHPFLKALEASGSVGPATGWTPRHIAVYEDGRLAAFAPTYLKDHSHGEFVFDWSWADAYRRLGLPYYPKLLTAIPYSPVGGPRLLVRRGHPEPETLRYQLVESALAACTEHGLSSWHCNFVPDSDREALEVCELLPRHDWQFHWHNDDFADFDHFLTRLTSRKRKNIRRERLQVQQAGIRFRWLSGSDLQTRDVDFLYRCYTRTFRQYGNHPALNRAFFEAIAAALGEQFLLILAERDGASLAAGVFLVGPDRLYGRYWGCVEELPGLHFETAYYQGMEYCIHNGIRVFESGAQGEHKISRGFLPRRTRSYHWLRDEQLRRAVGDYLRHERAWMDEYGRQLARHDPYRCASP